MNRKQRTALQITPEALPYLETLRRIPAEIRLSMATREMDVSGRTTCICGWAIREAVARELNLDANDVPRDHNSAPPFSSSALAMRDLFGGTYDEWDVVYWESPEYSSQSPFIEEAFLIAVAEAAEGRWLVGSTVPNAAAAAE